MLRALPVEDYKRMAVLTTIFVSRLEDEEGRPCSELFLLEDDEYRLLENGSLIHIDYEVCMYTFID